jgi:hypothetical protein
MFYRLFLRRGNTFNLSVLGQMLAQQSVVCAVVLLAVRPTSAKLVARTACFQRRSIVTSTLILYVLQRLKL